MSRQVIRVFEYDKIRVDEIVDKVQFKVEHLNSLARYKEQNQHNFYNLIYNGVQFREYVGIIQVGNLTIEVLPKADKDNTKDIGENKKNAWKCFLIQMLKKAGYLDVSSLTESYLHLRNTTLFDLYIHSFLNNLDQLIKRGIVKKYRKEEGNLNNLKGRLVFNKHLQQNLIHKERFYIQYQSYDYEHILNQILLEAIMIIRNNYINPLFQDKINRILVCFPEINRRQITLKSFENLKYNRKTEHYRNVINLAKLIILNYCPDIQNNNYNTLAILFNMYDLWQVYIYKMLLKNRDGETKYELNYNYENTEGFWELDNQRAMNTRPDFIIKLDNKRYIIDTKWKILKDCRPSEQDLYQMFVYNHNYNCELSLLLYPDVYNLDNSKGTFLKNYISSNNNQPVKHFCKLGFVKVYNEKEEESGNIVYEMNNDIAKRIIELL